jgi:prepilin-type N-terminal cleavage/methylation domain-containing protein/prepilin-type processing-associated H-X9-DG protein
MAPGRKAGFTLVELLIVIAVIAIIAGILFPVFAQARENARGAMCLNHLKQIGAGLLMYSQDYDEVILPWAVSTGKPKQLQSPDPLARRADVLVWTQLVAPYLKNQQVLYCPSFNEPAYIATVVHPSCDGAAFRTAFPAYYLAHYGIARTDVSGGCVVGNPRVAMPGNHPSVQPMKRLAQVQRPAETAMAQDNATLQTVSTSNGFMGFGCECGVPAIGQGRHHQGCNYLFLDGHVKVMNLNPQREPLIPCPGAKIGAKSYPDCVCAGYMTWDY